MKMVASAKLHKAQGRIGSMLPYQTKLNGILTNFLGTDISFRSPYTEVRPVARVAIVALSSNSSLCGAFNSNVARLLERVLGEYKDLPREDILIYPIGKKVEAAVKKLGYKAQGSYRELSERPSYEAARLLSEELMKFFVEKKIDRVELIYHHFRSAGVQILTREDYLPIDLSRVAEANNESQSGGSGYNNDYIVEPSIEAVMSVLLPKVLSQKIYTVLLDSSASEHAARMLAMQTATDNADDLIQELTKQYNKGRQQAITNELLDIVGASFK